MNPDSSSGPAHHDVWVKSNPAVDEHAPDAARVAQPSQRGTLTHEKVLTAAVVVIDTGGVDNFTLREVADRLGVETMALYRYFPSRRELLNGVVEYLSGELFAGSTAPSNTERWQDFLTRVAFSVRSSALAHPPLFRLIASTATAAPWIRPPLRNLHTVEQLLETFHRCGFGDAAALTAYHGFAGFLLGHLLLDVNLLNTPVNLQEIDTPGYPRLRHLRTELAQDHSADDFQRSLNLLISGVDLLEHHHDVEPQHAQPPPPVPAA